MINPEHITHEQLAQMLKAVIESGKATGLIRRSYLTMMEAVVVQMRKTYLRQQAQVAIANRQAARAEAQAAATSKKSTHLGS